jgi:hypothetical protein
MRPVNLIPKDQRRGDRAAMRTGVASYVLLGALVMAVLAVAVLALTSKQISDHKSEIAQLQVQEQAAVAKAQSLQSFTTFRAAQEARSARSRALPRAASIAAGASTSSRGDPSNVWATSCRIVDPTVTVTMGRTSRRGTRRLVLPEMGLRVQPDAPWPDGIQRSTPSRG